MFSYAPRELTVVVGAVVDAAVVVNGPVYVTLRRTGTRIAARTARTATPIPNPINIFAVSVLRRFNLSQDYSFREKERDNCCKDHFYSDRKRKSFELSYSYPEYIIRSDIVEDRLRYVQSSQKKCSLVDRRWNHNST